MEKLVYKEPLYQEALRPEDFQSYLQQNFLGYIDTVRAEPTENRYQGTILRQVSIERTQSVYSVSGGSIAETFPDASDTPSSQSDSTTIYDGSDRQENISDRYTSLPLNSAKVAELVSYTNLKRFDGSHLLSFFSVLFFGESVWISGWNKNMFKRKDTVLTNAKLPDFITVKKKKKGDPRAEQPTIMAPFGESILFAKANGNDIYSLNLTSNRIKRVFSIPDLSIAAMSTSSHHVFIFNRNETNFI